MAKFKFIKDFNALAYIGGESPSVVKTFKIGDVIEGGNNPSMEGMQTKSAIPIQTTVEGKMPNWDMEGQLWLSIPFNVIQEVSADTPTTDTPTNNDKVGFSVNQRLMIWVGLLGIGYLIYKNQ
jgi:hypothetical protein